RRGRRSKRASWTRGHRRPALRHRGYPSVRPSSLCCVSWTQVENGEVLTMTINQINNFAVATEPAQNDPGSNNSGPNDPGPTNPGRAFSKRAIAIAAIVTVCAAGSIASGLHSRLAAETRLRASAQGLAIPYVDVVSAKASADGD